MIKKIVAMTLSAALLVSSITIANPGVVSGADVSESVTEGSESVTEGKESVTEGREGVVALSDVRSVYINTNGEAIKKDGYVDAEISILDKVGGDTYESTKEYAPIYETGGIKIRGNSTSEADKKPYNIKLSQKQNVFGMGKAKKWSLLANAFDKSLLRNKLAMGMATDMGLAYTSNSTYVDLFINGEYYGNYVLIESVETGKERVDIDTDNGSDILLERERDRYEEGESYIRTAKYGMRFVIGDPEGLSQTTEQYKTTLAKLNNFEDALESENFEKISSCIDVQSFVDFYIVNEFFKNVDFDFSSTRFYIKDGTIYAGPLWDLDLSSGNLKSSRYTDYYDKGVSYKGMYCQNFKWFSVLMHVPEFKSLVNSRYKEVQPLINNIISGNGKGSINAITSTYKDTFARNYLTKEEGGAGWSVTKADSMDSYSYAEESGWQNYNDSVEFLREWFKNRNEYLLSEFAKISLGSVTAESTVIDGKAYKNLIKNGNINVAASSVENDGGKAENAIDGNTTSRWSSAFADNQNITLDLGKTYELKALSVMWEAASANTYEVLVSEDGKNYTKVAHYESNEGNRTDDILLDEAKEARYVKINCLTRNTVYGFSIYEIALWGNEAQTITISNDIVINGYQISTAVGGIRTVYSVEDKINTMDVQEVGLIYGIDKDGFDKKDMVIGNTNDKVSVQKGTEEKGRLNIVFSKKKSYAMTMTFGMFSKDALTTKYYVRAYARLSDGTYVYTKITDYNVYDVADNLYQGHKMSTYEAHNYLYEKILKFVNPEYQERDFDWDNNIVPIS